MIVAVTEESASIFITERQEDGTWLLENCSNDASYWTTQTFLSHDEVLKYHRHYGDTILHDDG